MTTASPNLFTRDDTFLGVCEALGEDFGIHANWLRLGMAGALFFAPVPVIVAYLAMGVLVAVSRWLFPAPAALAIGSDSDAAPSEQAEVAQTVDVVEMRADEDELLPLAA
jgi:phage shock protein PspC (stress-responsive transcriptional regulator)